MRCGQGSAFRLQGCQNTRLAVSLIYEACTGLAWLRWPTGRHSSFPGLKSRPRSLAHALFRPAAVSGTPTGLALSARPLRPAAARALAPRPDQPGAERDDVARGKAHPDHGGGRTVRTVFGSTGSSPRPRYDRYRQHQPGERRHDGAAGNPGPLDIIRRQFTEGAVRAMDRRALFVGVDAYEAAGGVPVSQEWP